MTTIITCPDRYADQPGIKVFVAGGISNCPNWQEEFIFLTDTISNHVSNKVSLILINPRRNDFDVNDPSASDFQIQWEHDHLTLADIVVFWFPKETLCPITLFELGKVAAGSNKYIIVGTHSEYQRRFDVIKQLSLLRPDVVVHSDVHAIVNELLSVVGMGDWYEALMPYKRNDK